VGSTAEVDGLGRGPEYAIRILGGRGCNTAFVGADIDDQAGVDSGAVYVFHYDGTRWVEKQKLTASDPLPGSLRGRRGPERRHGG